MENHQQQQQPKQQKSDDNEEMWNLFEENSFFFTDDESIDEDINDIDVKIAEDRIDIDESIVKDKVDIDSSIAKNKKDVDMSIDKDKDINDSIAEDKEDLNLSTDVDRNIDVMENIDVSIGEDKEVHDKSIAENKEAINLSIDEDMEDIDESIVEDREDTEKCTVEDKENIDVNIGNDKEVHDQRVAKNKEFTNLSIDEDMEDIDECIVEDMEDIDKCLVENKENIDVSVDGNKKDIDENIIDDKEEIDVSIVEDKEDMDKSKYEHNEDINENLDKDREDIWRLFEELYPDDSKSVDISDAKGKSIENMSENSTKSKNKDEGDKTTEDANDVNIEIQKNFNGINNVSPESCSEMTQRKANTSAKRQHVNDGSESTTTSKKRKLIFPHEKKKTTDYFHHEIFAGEPVSFCLKEIGDVDQEYESYVGFKGNKYKGIGKSKYAAKLNAAEVAVLSLMQGEYGQEVILSKDAMFMKVNLAKLLLDKEHLKENNGNYFCNLCSTGIGFFKEIGSFKNLFFHINTKLHKTRTKRKVFMESQEKEHITEESGIFFCKLCSAYITDSFFEHVECKKHKKKELISNFLVLNREYIKEEDGKYFCSLCSLFTHNCFIHVNGKLHELNSKESLTDEELLIKDELSKGHIKDNCDGKLYCTLCSENLLISKSILEHLKGIKHMESAEINNYWGKESLKEFLLFNKEYIKERDGKFICNVVNCSPALLSPKGLHEHVQQENHVLNIELSKGNIKEESLGIYFCNLCSTKLQNIKSLLEHVEGKHKNIDIELSKGHIKEESLGKYYCNLCSTTLLNTKSLLEHVEGKKHKNNLELSLKGIFNNTHENDYYKVIEEEVLLSSKTTIENSYLSSMEEKNLKKCENIDTNENKVIEEGVLSSKTTIENSYLSSMEEKDLKCDNIDINENESNRVHIIQEKLSSCEDPVVLEALSIGHLKLNTLGEFTCTLCDVSSTKLATVKIHLKGKKHKLKAKEFIGNPENDASSSQTDFKDIPKGYFINMSGLPETATEHDILEFFSPVDIVSIRFIVASTEEDLSSHIGEADVGFLSQDDATIAMAKHLSIMEDNIIQLTLISTSVPSKCLQNPLVSNNPVSLRLVVTDSQDVSMKIGTVIVLTSDHATIILESRDYKKFKDLNVNDNETLFYMRETEEFRNQYFVRDLGSKGGTLLNGTLICPRGSHSDFIKVNHDDIIQCGLVTLVCHIHPISSFCFDCEKETKIPAATSSKSIKSIKAKLKSKSMSTKLKEIEEVHRANQKDELETSRRKELKAIRKKHGLTFMYNKDQEHLPNDPEYKDRANKRRKQVGSDNPYEKTEVAHTSLAISSKNKGFKMLASMGWKEGEGLGKDNSGMLEPIRGDEVKDNRTGLGSMQVGGPCLSFKQKEKLQERRKILDITKERFYK